MKISSHFQVLSFLIIVILTTSCLRYNALPLSDLSYVVSDSVHSDEVVLAAKAFTPIDCKSYLDRNVLRKGYQPVQLYIENNSEDDYRFSPNRVNLVCAKPKEVAKKMLARTSLDQSAYLHVNRSDLGMAVGLIFDHLTIEANRKLYNDFLSKSVVDRTILPHTNVNMLLFVPIKEYRSDFTVTLLKEPSYEPRPFHIRASWGPICPASNSPLSTDPDSSWHSPRSRRSRIKSRQ